MGDLVKCSVLYCIVEELQTARRIQKSPFHIWRLTSSMKLSSTQFTGKTNKLPRVVRWRTWPFSLTFGKRSSRELQQSLRWPGAVQSHFHFNTVTSQIRARSELLFLPLWFPSHRCIARLIIMSLHQNEILTPLDTNLAFMFPFKSPKRDSCPFGYKSRFHVPL